MATETISSAFSPMFGRVSTEVPHHPFRHHYDPLEQENGIINILDELETVLSLRYYHLALVTALCIPDICGGIEAPDNKASGAAYKQWFDCNMSSYIKTARGTTLFNGHECYLLRCSLLHQGLSTHEKSSFERVSFCHIESPAIIHKSRMGKLYIMCLDYFCMDMSNAARAWYGELDETGKSRVNEILKPQVEFGTTFFGMPLLT